MSLHHERENKMNESNFNVRFVYTLRQYFHNLSVVTNSARDPQTTFQFIARLSAGHKVFVRGNVPACIVLFCYVFFSFWFLRC